MTPAPESLCVVFQQFVLLKDFTMDFTLEDWEQLGLDQGDVFWDTALDNYQNLFLLSEYAPRPCSVIACDSPSPHRMSSQPLGAPEPA